MDLSRLGNGEKNLSRFAGRRLRSNRASGGERVHLAGDNIPGKGHPMPLRPEGAPESTTNYFKTKLTSIFVTLRYPTFPYVILCQPPSPLPFFSGGRDAVTFYPATINLHRIHPASYGKPWQAKAGIFKILQYRQLAQKTLKNIIKMNCSYLKPSSR
jgi:hypothetical protein